MNVFYKISLLCFSFILFSCSSTRSDTSAALYASKAANTSHASIYARTKKSVQQYQRKHKKSINAVKPTQKRSLYAKQFSTSKPHSDVNTRNSMADRELMLAFYRAPKTTDLALMEEIIAEEEAYVRDNHTGYETMYVRNITARGAVTVDPASARYKALSRQNNARFGMAIAGR